MLRRIPLAALLALPLTLSAQEGTVAYTHSTRIDAEALEAALARMGARAGAPGGDRAGPPGAGRRALPTERTRAVVLLFDASESLMKAVPSEDNRPGGEGRPRPGVGDNPGGAFARRPGGRAFMRMGGASRASQESLVEVHVGYDAGVIVETREFLGRRFLIEGERPALRWKLTGEQAVFLDLPVLKATTVHDSLAVEAWFTPQIPVSAGPAHYGGLPGMILVVSIDDGREQYTATDVSMAPIEEGVIARPTEGDAVTREEYEKIVAEKLEELRMIGGGGGS